jgi:hypothetical protein
MLRAGNVAQLQEGVEKAQSVDLCGIESIPLRILHGMVSS